jgi:hypothetical protein
LIEDAVQVKVAVITIQNQPMTLDWFFKESLTMTIQEQSPRRSVDNSGPDEEEGIKLEIYMAE